jgi:cation diffusion facilitator family transporter
MPNNDANHRKLLPRSEDAPDRRREVMAVLLIGLVFNLLLAGVQVFAGLLTRSTALTAEGAHSLADSIADALLLAAAWHGGRPPDREHPYGHQRIETAAALVVGLALAAGGLAIIVTTAAASAVPSTVQPAALVVAVLVLFGKEALFRFLQARARRIDSTLLAVNAWHARADAASSLVVLAGIAGSVAGFPLLDRLAAGAVGAMIGWAGCRFCWNALQDLVDRSAPAPEVEAIRECLAATPGVLGVHELRVRRVGDLLAADAHIEVHPHLSVAAGHAIAAAARERVLGSHRVAHIVLHVDPSEQGLVRARAVRQASDDFQPAFRFFR